MLLARRSLPLLGALATLLPAAPLRSRAQDEIAVRVVLELRDGEQCTCDQPPQQIAVRVEVPGRAPEQVLVDESLCGFGSDVAPDSVLISATCFCAGMGVDVWVRRAGNALLVEEQVFVEELDEPQRPRRRLRVAIPRGMQVVVERRDLRGPEASARECAF